MAARKFKFQLQPALDKALAEQDKAEQALRHARRALAQAEAKLAELRAIVERTTQQIRVEHDNLTRPAARPASALGFVQRDEYIAALKLRRDREQQAADKQQSEVAWCRQRLELRQQELKEAMSQVQALERLRDKALAEHRKELDRAMQNEIDEAGIQAAARRRRQP